MIKLLNSTKDNNIFVYVPYIYCHVPMDYQKLILETLNVKELIDFVVTKWRKRRNINLFYKIKKTNSLSVKSDIFYLHRKSISYEHRFSLFS